MFSTSISNSIQNYLQKALDHCYLTHCGRVMQICVFTLQLCKMDEQICIFNTRLVSMHYTLNYAIHGAFLQMVLLTDVYRN